MKITKEEVLLALKISKIIQKRIDITGKTNLRSTDVFPYLERAGLFEPDKHNGIHFRSFLNKLAHSGELQTLIPQCTHVKPLKEQIFSEWYFHCAKNKMPKPKLEPALESNHELKTEIKENYEMDINEAVDIVKLLIAGIHPITKEKLQSSDVCTLQQVQDALTTIINPKSYQLEIEKIKGEYSSDIVDVLTTDDSDWFEKITTEINSWESTLDIKKLTAQKQTARLKYPRAYEKWTSREQEILIQAYELLKNECKVAKLLQRSKNSIVLMLENLTQLEKL